MRYDDMVNAQPPGQDAAGSNRKHPFCSRGGQALEPATITCPSRWASVFESGLDRIDVEPQVSTARPLNTLLTITASYDSLCVIQLNWAIYNYREALTDRDN